ncbi:MAG: DALR domain-containing protein, partial [Pirellulales bacterium]
AKYWMHNGLLQKSSEVGKLGGRNTREAKEGDLDSQAAAKLSKSTGAAAFSDLLKQFPAETIRFFLLATHYRRPIEFSDEQIQDKQKGLEQFYRFFARFERVTGENFYKLRFAATRAEGDAAKSELAEEHRGRFLEAMDDDFNTGGGAGVLFELVSALNRYIDAEKLENPGQKDPAKLAALRAGTATLRELAATMGLFREPAQASSAGNDELVGKLMQLLIEIRADARQSKNFATADKVRKSLAEFGVVLEDRPDGTGWSLQK